MIDSSVYIACMRRSSITLRRSDTQFHPPANSVHQITSHHMRTIYSESKNPPPPDFLTFFSTRMGIFTPNFTHLLYVPINVGLQIFIQLTATMTKLCHIKIDHHNVLKMSTIDRNARLVVALNMT